MTTLNNIGSGFNRSIINDNFEKIEDALNNKVLKRSGVLPSDNNSMEEDLDMNSNRILNTPSPIRDADVANKGYVDGQVGSINIAQAEVEADIAELQESIEKAGVGKPFSIVGSFEAGFSYTEVNQVGTYTVGGDKQYYTYTGSVASLPFSVSAGTNPVGNNTYEKVIFNSASDVITDDGSSVQDFIDNEANANSSKSAINALTNLTQATDGWGSGIKGFNKKTLEAETLSPDFVAPTVGPNRPSVGEWFNGACYADGYIWLAPQDADYFVRYDPYRDETVTVDASSYVYVSNGATKKDRFNGVVYDGEYVWFIPSWTDKLVRIHNITLDVTEVEVNVYGDDAYNGGIFDGEYIWNVTHDANDLVRVNVNTLAVERFSMTSTGVDISLGDASFLGGSFDGDNTIWLHPRKSKFLVSVNRTTGAVTGTYEHPVADQSATFGYFHGGSFDGRYIWFSSYTSTKLCWFDTKKLEWGSETHGLQGTTQFNLGSTFDGRFVYFTPFKSTEQLIVDTLTGSWSKVPSPLESYTSSGVVSGAALFVNGEVFYCPSVGGEIYKTKLYDYEKNTVTTGNHVIMGDLQVNGDSVANSSSLTLPVEVNGSAENVSIIQSTFNPINASFSFTGTNRIEIPTLDIDSSNGITILLRAKINSNNNGRLLTNVLEFASTNGFDINATALSNSIGFEGGEGLRIYPMNTGAATDVAFVIENSTSIEAYINGTLTAPTIIDGLVYENNVAIPNSSNNVHVGNIFNSGSWNRPLDGEIYRIEIFEEKLSLAQIQSWNSGTDLGLSSTILTFDGNDNVPDENAATLLLGRVKIGSKRIRSDSTGLYVDRYNGSQWVLVATLA